MKFFTAHLDAIGESYFKHMCMAIWFGISMLIAGILFIIHSVFPFLFENAGSNILFRLCNRFVTRMPAADERVKQLDQAIRKKI